MSAADSKGVVYVPNRMGLPFFIDEVDADEVLAFNWCVAGPRSAYLVSGFLRKRRDPYARLHRFIMKPEKGFVVDHINGNYFDNRRVNLRVCTLSENNRNKRKLSAGSSVYKGAYKGISKKKPWFSQIRDGKRNVYLGAFGTEIEAALAYDEAARKFHGEFACLNFPREGEVSAFSDYFGQDASDRFPHRDGIARNCRVSGKLRAASAQALPSTMLDAACFSNSLHIGEITHV